MSSGSIYNVGRGVYYVQSALTCISDRNMSYISLSSRDWVYFPTGPEGISGTDVAVAQLQHSGAVHTVYISVPSGGREGEVSLCIAA